ncbi:MAG: hypothetical protein WAT09_03385 [Paracoccaceae bacterium]
MTPSDAPAPQPSTDRRPATKRPIKVTASKGVALALGLTLLAIVAIGAAVAIWGPIALTFAALPVVPIMFIIFIWISLP